MGIALAQVGGESSSEEGAFAAIPGEEGGILQGEEEGQGGWGLERRGRGQEESERA